LDAVKALGKRAHRMVAFFGCLYYAGTRPSEAADLRRDDCELPGKCHNCGTQWREGMDKPASRVD
jgi:integrase